MRPKKVILCVLDDEQDLSVLSFMLSTNGYRVIATTDGRKAITLFVESSVDLVIADFVISDMPDNNLVQKLKAIAGYIPVLMLWNRNVVEGSINCADSVIDPKTCTVTDLLERVKIMAQRKRGPRKGTIHKLTKPAIISTPVEQVALAGD